MLGVSLGKRQRRHQPPTRVFSGGVDAPLVPLASLMGPQPDAVSVTAFGLVGGVVALVGDDVIGVGLGYQVALPVVVGKAGKPVMSSRPSDTEVILITRIYSRSGE